MSEQNPYETLGVAQDASFDDIQQAKSRLSQEFGTDRRQVETIEAAYDAIIMERLRLRQEGKISVPEGIRFPERQATETTAAKATVPAKSHTFNLQQWLDTPEQKEVWIATCIFSGLGIATLFILPPAPASSLATILALALGVTLYLLTRKENRFGRACLLTFGGFVLSMALAIVLHRLVAIPVGNGGLSAPQLTTLITLLVFWVTSSFLR